MLMFLYIFVWPFILPLICIAVTAWAPRRLVVRAGSVLALVTIASAAPLAYAVAKSTYPDGIALSSLSLYPTSLAALFATAIARVLVVWFRRRSRQNSDRQP